MNTLEENEYLLEEIDFEDIEIESDVDLNENGGIKGTISLR